MSKKIELGQAFAGWMAGKREKLGVTLPELSDKSGVSKASVYQIEAGATCPRLSTAAKISNALDTPLWKALKEVEDGRARATRK